MRQSLSARTSTVRLCRRSSSWRSTREHQRSLASGPSPKQQSARRSRHGESAKQPKLSRPSLVSLPTTCQHGGRTCRTDPQRESLPEATPVCPGSALVDAPLGRVQRRHHGVGVAGFRSRSASAVTGRDARVERVFASVAEPVTDAREQAALLALTEACTNHPWYEVADVVERPAARSAVLDGTATFVEERRLSGGRACPLPGRTDHLGDG